MESRLISFTQPDPKSKSMGLRGCLTPKGGSREEVLTEDIITEEILTRLPVETLIRFRSVCKSWESLFFSPRFIHSHFTRTNNQNFASHDCLIGFEIDKLIILSRHKQTKIAALPSLGTIHGSLRLVASINGLVCLINNDDFFLWNPMIGRYKKFTLPQQYSQHKTFHNRFHGGCRYLSGFGFESNGNDYKVVACYFSDHSRQGAIYSSNSDTWTKLVIPDYIFPSHIFQGSIGIVMTPTTIVNECPYWTYSNYLHQMRRKYTAMVKFEIHTNEFRLLPELDPAILRGKDFDFVNVKDCLAVMVYKSEHPDRIKSPNNSVEVYLLHEEHGVWNKMYTIGPLQSNVHIWKLLQGFKYGDEIVLLEDEKVFYYDPKTDEIKGLLGSLDPRVLSYLTYTPSLVLTYTPSLVFLQGMKLVEDQTIKPSKIRSLRSRSRLYNLKVKIYEH